MNDGVTKAFYLNNFRIEPEINTIISGKSKYKIEPKIMQVLMCLVEARGELVTKEHLFKTVWAETVVVEMVLTRAISELRNVFRDKSTDPRFIETISKSGYRLVARVSSDNPGSLKDRLRSGKVVTPAIMLSLLILIAFGFLQSDPPLPVSSKPFTSDKGWEYHPAFSPDGEWIAYIGQSGNQYSNIYLRSTLNDSTIRLTDSDGFFLKPSWSPDGNKIAAFGGKGSHRAIYIYSVKERSVENEIMINTQYVGLAWSPNGNDLAYVGYDSINSRHTIFEYSISDSNSASGIFMDTESWGDSEPRYSPDGKKLAFVRTISEGDQDIYQFDLKSAKLRRLTRINSNVKGFDWQDESTLLMSSDLDGKDNLWKVKVDPDNDPVVTEKVIKVPYGESIQNPTINSGLLVGERWVQDTDIIIRNLTNLEEADGILLTSSQWELHPDVSPDGQQIAFSSNRSGHYEIWKYSILNNKLEQLTQLEEGFSGKPKWSPDGLNIIFESNATGTHQIYMMTSDGKNLKQLTTGGADHINPTWSRDGSAVYCASNVDGDWNIWAQAIKNGRLRKVSTSRGYYLQESPVDFGRTFFTRLHEPGIWEIKHDGREVKIIDDLNSVDWGNWSVNSQGIHFFNRHAKRIDRYDFETQAVTDLISVDINFPANDPGLTVSLEAGLLLYGAINSYSGDLVAIRNY